MFTTFAFSLSGGMLAVLSLAPVSKIAWRFLRLAGLLAAGIGLVVLVWHFRAADWNYRTFFATWAMKMASICVLAAVASTMWAPFSSSKPMIYRTFCLIGGVCGIISATFLSKNEVEIGDSIAKLGLIVAGNTLGAVLLGSITVAWLLGHAYLTATKMTIAPLRQASRLLSMAIAARILFLLFSMLFGWLTGMVQGDELAQFARNNWLILSLRVGVGLIGVGVFSWMVADCVRLRSTQSATGILYFGSVFCYVGELASLDLLPELGWSA